MSDIIKYDLSSASVSGMMIRIFHRAKEENEFQFACAILPAVRGIPPYGRDDPLNETERFVRDMVGLINAPLEYMAKIRLGLLAYVRMVESKPVYEELSNILRIIAGHRAIPEPFGDLYVGSKRRPPPAKRVVGFLCCQARGVDEESMAEEMEGMYDDAVRNAVSHADYFFHDGCFMSDWRRQGNPTRLCNGIPLDELERIVLRGASFFEAVRNASVHHRKFYTESKLVRACSEKDGFSGDVWLLADEERGLYELSGV